MTMICAGPVTKPVGHRRRAHRPGRRGNQEDEDVVYKTVSPVRGEASGVDAGAAVEGTYTAEPAGPPAIPAAGPPAPGTQGHAVVHKRVNYDDIFNVRPSTVAYVFMSIYCTFPINIFRSGVYIRKNFILT